MSEGGDKHKGRNRASAAEPAALQRGSGAQTAGHGSWRRPQRLCPYRREPANRGGGEVRGRGEAMAKELKVQPPEVIERMRKILAKQWQRRLPNRYEKVHEAKKGLAEHYTERILM